LRHVVILNHPASDGLYSLAIGETDISFATDTEFAGLHQPQQAAKVYSV
jgi:hypothetical protein